MSLDALKTSWKSCRLVKYYKASVSPCTYFNLLPPPLQKDAFSDQWFLLERLTAREKEKALAKEVMKDIDQQVKEMMVHNNYNTQSPLSNPLAHSSVVLSSLDATFSLLK